MQKAWGLIFILVVILIIVSVGVFYLRGNNQKLPDIYPTEKSCTLEAKICSDGSSVGRTGPNCEFAACPVIIDKTDK